jgi:hypothetical protein
MIGIGDFRIENEIIPTKNKASEVKLASKWF